MRTKELLNCFEVGALSSSIVADVQVSGAELDTRKLECGNIFFACNGEQVDGNAYAQSALTQGASVAVMDNKKFYENVIGNKILVRDSKQAVIALGKQRLAALKAKKIAITGSYGKTTTKDILKGVAGLKYKVQSAQGNHNNLLGVLLTACGIEDETEILIFELGSNAMGEIEELSQLVCPNIVIITGVGYAHVGNFGSIANTKREKLSIVNGLSGHADDSDYGVVIARDTLADDILELAGKRGFKAIFYGATDKADYQLAGYKFDGNWLHFSIKTDKGELKARIPYPYPHIAEDYLAGFALAGLLNIPYKDVVKLVAEYIAVDGRGDILFTNNRKLTVINDTYNASLEAVIAAIKSLALRTEAKKYALLGEIGEINGYEADIYGALLDEAAKQPNINFIFSGLHYKGYKQATNIRIVTGEKATKDALADVKSGVILIKASHSKGFDRYVKYLAEDRI
ncbi:UDP-N-acetylmuramoylalanyl-D-glutamyl-2,6-diamino pimelate--D-alanyl-D-alanine ligase [Deferribacterales bacterium RsTz2092]|nr:UDP-N-acetylmuramoyl-tripeptide--D-alanyl-D-alanine ligase [Deferribacterales bacterium]